MPPYYLILAVQGLCVLHALRNRAEQKWLWIIVFLPLLGCAAYIWLEILPRVRSGGLPRIDLPMLEKLRTKQLEKAFAFSDTIDNRIAVAQAYLNNGRVAAALELYRPAIQGPFKNNPYLLYGYARACFANDALADTCAVLERAETLNNAEKLRQRRLLWAMALEKLEQFALAEERFQDAVKGFPSEEARCRYAIFLWARGRKDEALVRFTAIDDTARHSDWAYRRREKPWIAIARAKLREHAKAPT